MAAAYSSPTRMAASVWNSKWPRSIYTAARNTLRSRARTTRSNGCAGCWDHDSLRWRMTDKMSKRKYAGPRIQELRKIDQDPARVPPHKKPRKYRLSVKYTRVKVGEYSKEFHTKEAMLEFRRRVERAIREEKERQR